MTWTCEFCYERTDENPLPAAGDFVWQSAVCPSCKERVKSDGGYGVVLCGAYASDRPDPRDRDLAPAVEAAEALVHQVGDEE